MYNYEFMIPLMDHDELRPVWTTQVSCLTQHHTSVHLAALGFYREEDAGNSGEEQHQLEHQDGCHLLATPQHADGDQRAHNPADLANGGRDPDPRRAN